MNPGTRRIGWGAALLYLATAVGANWLVEEFGTATVGFGLYAPAAVYAVGPALVLRDVVQRTIGVRAAIAAVAAGTGLSYLVANPAIASASAVSFAVSELADGLVYSTLARNLVLAVFCSGIAGLVADSVMFPMLAFGSLALTPGHLVGKTYGVIAGIAAIAAMRRCTGAL